MPVPDVYSTSIVGKKKTRKNLTYHENTEGKDNVQ
jgi:hypothetical protein